MNPHIRAMQDFYDLQTSCFVGFNMALPGTSRGLETYDISDVFKQSSDEKVCNCDNASEVDAFDFVSSMVKQA
jgi:hypothetical protein